MRTALLTCLLLMGGLLRTAHAADPFAVSEGFVVLGHSYDLATTQRCRGANTCRELNPYLARFESPFAVTSAKIPLALAQLWLSRQLRDHGHPKLATGLNFATGALLTAVGARNARLTARLGRP